MEVFSAVVALFFLMINESEEIKLLGCPYHPLDLLHVGLSEHDDKPMVKQKRNVRLGAEHHMDELLTTFNSAANSWYNVGEVEKRTPEPIKCGVPPVNCLNDTTNLQYRSIDGGCNNLLYPEYGIATSRYNRLLRPAYIKNGQTVPNARLLSLSMYGEKTLMDQFRTVASMQFGQFVAHDISLLTTKGAPRDCCAEARHPRCQPITLAAGGPISYNTGRTCISFARSISDADAICPKNSLHHSEKLSVVTAFLDLSSIYGNSIKQNKRVRLFKSGQLRTSHANGEQWVPVTQNHEGECGTNSECYSMPDKRNRFTPTMAVLHTVLLREHNRLAEQLSVLNPHYSDERLYQEARKINIAQYQKITYYDYLVAILGSQYTNSNGLTYPYSQHTNEYVNDYDEGINPNPYAEFSAAAFRYSHTQIPGWFSMVAPNRHANQTMRLSDYFERTETIRLLSSNFADLVRGMVTQLQKRADGNIDPEVKHFFNRKAFQDFGSDLKTLDIQRARDFGLASYNDARELCGLSRAKVWTDLVREIPQEKINLLRKLYTTPAEVELGVGGTLEFHVPDSLFGPTLLCIVGKQFQNTRQGDRFFFERENQLSGFSRSQLAEIRKVTLASLFCSNVQGLHYIQPNVFIFPNTRNILMNCNDIPQLDLSKWQDLTPQLVN